MIKEDLELFKKELVKEEKTEKTIKQYVRYITEFIEITQLNNKEEITKELLIDYKDKLIKKHKKKLNSINIKIIIVNKFIAFLRPYNDEAIMKTLKLKQEKQQMQNTLENVLTMKEYNHIRDYAKKNNQSQLYYLMGTLQGTGIRTSELKYITLEAVKKQEVDIQNKGKLRKIPIQDKVKKELLQYCKEKGINNGVIFKTRNNKPLDNACIWRQLQKLAGQVRSGLKKSKMHAHSFRHLFAKEYLENGGNALDLANILGHTSLETTRIYTTKSISEQLETLNKMSLNKS